MDDFGSGAAADPPGRPPPPPLFRSIAPEMLAPRALKALAAAVFGGLLPVTRRDVVQGPIAASVSMALLAPPGAAATPQRAVAPELYLTTAGMDGAEALGDSYFEPRKLSDLPPVADGFRRFFLCRHGETEYNRLRLVQGRRVDAPLNRAGVSQAELLGKALASQKIGIVTSSNLRRARETADIVAGQLPSGVAPARRPPLSAFDEIDFGIWEGRSGPGISAGMGVMFSLWGLGATWSGPPGGETLGQVLSRCQSGFRECAAACPEGSSVLVVSHSALIKAFLCASGAEVSEEDLGAGAEEGRSALPRKFRGLKQANCCVNVVDFSPATGEARVLLVNDREHLRDFERSPELPKAPKSRRRTAASSVLRALGWRS